MIQSDKFDSVNMDIKKITNTAFVFFVKRLSEIFGVIISISGLLLFISLISYSPVDKQNPQAEKGRCRAGHVLLELCLLSNSSDLR